MISPQELYKQMQSGEASDDVVDAVREVLSKQFPSDEDVIKILPALVVVTAQLLAAYCEVYTENANRVIH